MTKKGFTLIELLIVIAVLAVLSAAVVLVLNPAELLKQSRDSTRISDLAAINSALALWTADVSTPSPAWAATSTCALGATVTASPLTPFATGGNCQKIATTTVDSFGWVNVNLTQITGGSPLSRLPVDPLGTGTPAGTATNYYAFRATTTLGKYKLAANMESTKYANGGGSDVESATKDGGTNVDWYEIGSDMSL